MSEVKRISVFMHGPNKKIDMVEAVHLDRVTAEHDAQIAALKAGNEYAVRKCQELQSLLTAADERADVLEGLLRTSLVAMTRIYSAGRDLIIGAGSDCDSVELMMENDPTAREIRAALKPADVFVDPIKSCDVRRRAYLPGLWCKGLDGELQRVRAVLNPTPRLLLVPAGTGTTDLMR